MFKDTKYELSDRRNKEYLQMYVIIINNLVSTSFCTLDTAFKCCSTAYRFI